MPQRAANPERFSPTENLLLRGLPAAELGRLRSRMTLVPLAVGDVLQESGSAISHCYFPVSGLVSLLYVLEDGGTAELATVGNDGCVGIAALLGGPGGGSAARWFRSRDVPTGSRRRSCLPNFAAAARASFCFFAMSSR